jgi:uroporphyrinogen III methyltransferase / synthase
MTTRPRVLITRPAAQAEDLSLRLHDAGFTPVTLPTIAVEPLPDLTALDTSLRDLSSFQYVVFPSPNAARILAQRLTALAISHQTRPGPRIVAGPATARILAERGLTADVIPSPFSAEAALQSLESHSLQGTRILLPRAQEGREALGAGLRAHGADVVEVPIYRTVPVTELPALAEVVASGTLAAVTFFSPSAVTGFANALIAAGLVLSTLSPRLRIVCIGATTAAAAQGASLTVDAIARDTTTSAVVAALVDLLQPAHPAMFEASLALPASDAFVAVELAR